jgi:hypothetical protein
MHVCCQGYHGYHIADTKSLAWQLDMRGLDGVFSFKGSVAGSVNNALHIAKEQTGAAVGLHWLQCSRTMRAASCNPVVPGDTITCLLTLQARRRSSAATMTAPSRWVSVSYKRLCIVT